MKKHFIPLVVALCLPLLFSCAQKPHIVTISWDAPTVETDKNIGYLVYIDIDNDDNHRDKIALTPKPITNTFFSIDRHFYVGVQTVEVSEQDEITAKSRISWSSSEKDTKHGPFFIDFMK